MRIFLENIEYSLQLTAMVEVSWSHAAGAEIAVPMLQAYGRHAAVLEPS